MLNAILSAKEAKCNSLNIETDFDVALLNGKITENSDICRMLTNLLDNAINATQTVLSGRKIILKITEDDNSTIVTAKNPFDENKLKKSEEGHGYGLKIISDIVKKYNGRFDIDKENGFFVTQIILPNEK